MPSFMDDPIDKYKTKEENPTENENEMEKYNAS